MTDAERLARINELSRPLRSRSREWKLKPKEKETGKQSPKSAKLRLK